ncbi:MAG: NAD(P)H-dependent oxidoreductase [bacterium]
MTHNITLIQGHPDSSPERFCRALATAYADGAREAGHEVRTIEIATLDFPLLRSREESETQPIPPALVPAQADLLWADHIVVIFPLWLGTMPALLKGFLEQVIHLPRNDMGALTHFFAGKTGRVIVTMGMPDFIYRFYFDAAGVRTLERGILRLTGMGRIKESLIGMVETPNAKYRERWLARITAAGKRGD